MMSTITRIKGVIDNPDLPLLTANGLKSQRLGVYESAMYELGFTLTSAQESAIEAFLNTLSDAGVTDKIVSFYPFIGDSSIPATYGVPLIGDTSIPFTVDHIRSYTGTEGTIYGISNFPTDSSIKLSDITTIDKGFIVGTSFVNTAESFTNNFQRMSNFYNPTDELYIQLRFMKTERAAIFVVGDDKSLVSSMSGIGTRGNGYVIYGFGNLTSSYRYQRVFMLNDAMKMNTSGNDLEDSRVFSGYTASAFTMRTDTIEETSRTMSSIAFFSDVLSKTESAAFVSALSTLNKALGKEITI